MNLWDVQFSYEKPYLMSTGVTNMVRHSARKAVVCYDIKTAISLATEGFSKPVVHQVIKKADSCDVIVSGLK